MELLKEMCSIVAPSGNEGNMKQFIIDYVKKNQSKWKAQPQIIEGDFFQEALILVFGKPKTAVFAHTDSIGFMVGYDNELIKVGGPVLKDGMSLVGKDSHGEIETETLIIEDEESEGKTVKCISGRTIDRGTYLTFASNFRQTEEYVQTPYLDNRMGCYNALLLAENMENGALVFSTYEEVGGGSVGFLGKYLWENFQVRQALISDMTWVTKGIHHGKGVAISMRDSGVPRRKYLEKVIEIAEKSGVQYQLEVESAGGSDGTMLQKTDVSFDWVFIGAPIDNVHSPDEKVFISDFEAMNELYRVLVEEL